MVDPSIIAALTAALNKDEDNIPLRLHLASTLLDAGQADKALEQLTILLNKQPAHQDALSLASKAADILGDKIRAHGYRMLNDALSWTQVKSMIDGVAISNEGAESDSDKPVKRSLDDTGMPEKINVSDAGDDAALDNVEISSSTITLDDVAGLVDVKRRLNLAFLAPMRNPDMMRLYGRSLKGGLLLYGPPGCGKTYIARAVAGELGARFISVSLSDVLDMYLGKSEKNLHEIFESARRNKPCVLFFDEIDALGRKRSLGRYGSGTGIVNQLLAEMDGADGLNEGVFILAATNHPWDVDTALRRPGRLDRTILVIPPDLAAREAIIVSNMMGKPCEKLDTAWIAGQTEGYSGADIAHVCDSAAELAMERSMLSGIAVPISMSDLKSALKDVKASTRAWLEMAKNFALFSNDSGTYDDLISYLKMRRLI
jgi:SpoVK/Ycf46/Vps4 family AAA+-type ATPase